MLLFLLRFLLFRCRLIFVFQISRYGSLKRQRTLHVVGTYVRDTFEEHLDYVRLKKESNRTGRSEEKIDAYFEIVDFYR